MAQFDLYRLAGESDLIVDCQSDLLRDLSTRFVLPLVVSDDAEVLPGRLNPILLIAGARYRLMTHLPAALPRTLLRRPVGSVAEHRLVITAAIDVLSGGV